jgi:type VI secretion system protein ImpB
MTLESIQKRLERERPPRVQIRYDVEVGDTLETRELPFVLGILGDFGGQPRNPPPRLKERKFVQIDPDSFDPVLRAMAPRLALEVENRIQDAGDPLMVELEFKSMKDFEPDALARQVAPLRRLLALRQKLADLRHRLAGNDRLEEFLDGLARDPGRLRLLADCRPELAGGEP